MSHKAKKSEQLLSDPPEPETLKVVAVDSGPASLTIDGKDYPLVRIGLPELTEFLRWVKAHRPDPLEAIAPHMNRFSPEIQQVMIKDALAQFYKPITLGSPEFLEAFMTDEGLKELVWLSVLKAGHGLARKQSDGAVDALQEKGMDEVGRLFNTIAPNVQGLG